MGAGVSARPALFDFSAVHAQAQDSFARLRAAGFVVGLSPVQARPQHAAFAPAPEPLHAAAQSQYQHQPQQQEQQPPQAAPLPTASSSMSSHLGATQPAAPGLHHAQRAATTLNVALPMYVPPAPLVGMPQPPVSPPLGFFGFAGQPPATPGALAALQQLFQAQAQAPPTMAQTAMSGTFQQASASAARKRSRGGPPWLLRAALSFSLTPSPYLRSPLPPPPPSQAWPTLGLPPAMPVSSFVGGGNMGLSIAARSQLASPARSLYSGGGGGGGGGGSVGGGSRAASPARTAADPTLPPLQPSAQQQRVSAAVAAAASAGSGISAELDQLLYEHRAIEGRAAPALLDGKRFAELQAERYAQRLQAPPRPPQEWPAAALAAPAPASALAAAAQATMQRAAEAIRAAQALATDDGIAGGSGGGGWFDADAAEAASRLAVGEGGEGEGDEYVDLSGAASGAARGY